ncbi:MAG: mechanosensitive ion channel protein MscS, partial [Natronospirillum sp.]
LESADAVVHVHHVVARLQGGEALDGDASPELAPPSQPAGAAEDLVVGENAEDGDGLREDEAARQQLIDELRGASDHAGGVEAAEQTDEPMAFSRILASVTQEFAQNVVSEFTAAIAAFTDVGSADAIDYAAFFSEVASLLVVIAATLFVYWILRRSVRPLFDRISLWTIQPASRSALLRQTVAVIGAAVVDGLVVLLSWISGYLVALLLVGEAGEMADRETLFLNAFLLIELFKTVIRILFAARNNALRLLPMSAEDAAYWNAWLARLSSFIGYGVMLVVPIVNANLSPAVGRVATLIIMLVAFLYALAIILQNKATVTAKFRAAAENTASNYTRYSFGLLARVWHLAATAYFAALALVTLVRPDDALPLLLQATLQMALAVGVGVFVSIVLTQIISTQVHVSDDARRKYP